MRLIFSESEPDYSRYCYPYVVWAAPDPEDEPVHFFQAGFLPASPAMDSYYLTRQLRLPLGCFRLSSENRRILRKGAPLRCRLIAKGDYEVTADKRDRWLGYADARFGPGVMSARRLQGLLEGEVISHFLVFEDEARDGHEVGIVLLYLSRPTLAFYYYAFYDLEYLSRNLGMYMMTRAAELFAAEGFSWLHLGTCYSERALYKTQFSGIEFFNGFRWSSDLDSLKHLLRRDVRSAHALQDPVFLGMEGGLHSILKTRGFRLA